MPCKPAANSVLSDGTILRLVAEGRITISPWDESLLQPASVDLRLGASFRVFHNHKITAIDLRDPPRGLTEQVSPPEGEPFVIHPGEFCLGSTLEHVELPDDVVARIEGKSSLGRLGLIVHATAGFCDPGWKGTLTLELNNLTRVPIKLYPGLPIAQLSFMALDAPALRPYGHEASAATTRARSRPPRAATARSAARARAWRRSGSASGARRDSPAGAPRAASRTRREWSAISRWQTSCQTTYSRMRSGASSRRQLKLIRPLAEQEAQRVRWPRIVRPR